MLGDAMVDFATRLRDPADRLRARRPAPLPGHPARAPASHARMLQRARITADDLKARLDRGERITILDLRGAADVACHPYMLPGALRIGIGRVAAAAQASSRRHGGGVRSPPRTDAGRAGDPHTNVVLGLYRVGFERVDLSPAACAPGAGAAIRWWRPPPCSRTGSATATPHPSSGKRASPSARTSSRREEPESVRLLAQGMAPHRRGHRHRGRAALAPGGAATSAGPRCSGARYGRSWCGRCAGWCGSACSTASGTRRRTTDARS